METVYVVTDGCYSAYSIIAVCKTRELAEQLVSRGGPWDIEGLDDYHSRIEEWPLVTFTEDLGSRTFYYVEVDPEGVERYRYERSQRLYDEVDHDDITGNRWGGRTGRSPRGYGEALKAARDAMAQAKAEAAGIA